MPPYGNLSGNSGVVAYSIEPTAITVQFRNGGSYLYTYQMPGAAHVEQMKLLAERGAGLATYINKYVRGNYAAKL